MRMNMTAAVVQLTAVALFAQVYLVSAQNGAIPNRVLDLDGSSAWLGLPPHILDDLDSATVEA